MECFLNCSKNKERGMNSPVRPKIGILRIDYDYPPIPGDVDDERSFNFGVEYEIVKGLTFEKAQSGYINDEIRIALQIAVRKLERRNVVGLSGDCGFLMAYQKQVRQYTKLPVFMSSLLQTSIVESSIEDVDKIAILSANSKTLEPNLKNLLTECGIQVNIDKVYVIGCEDVEGFDAVAKGEKVDSKKVTIGIEKLVKKKLIEYPTTKAFIMECTELPCYSDTIRFATGLPVFDAITLINLFYCSCTDNPNFGLNNW